MVRRLKTGIDDWLHRNTCQFDSRLVVGIEPVGRDTSLALQLIVQLAKLRTIPLH